MQQGPDWTVLEYGQSEADNLRRLVRDQLTYIAHLERKVEALRREVQLLLDEELIVILGEQNVKKSQVR